MQERLANFRKNIGRIGAPLILAALEACTPSGSAPERVAKDFGSQPQAQECFIPADRRAMLPEKLAREIEERCEPPAIPRSSGTRRFPSEVSPRPTSTRTPASQTPPRTLPQPRSEVAPWPTPTKTPEPTPTLRPTPTETPKPILTPTPEAVKLSYLERCVECGASFNVEALESTKNNFRIRITIENTGQAGILQLIGDKSILLVFDLAQASQFRQSFPKFLREGRVEDLIRQVNPRTLQIRQDSQTRLPANIITGGKWSGWFAVGGPLPKEAVAFIFYLTPINREKPTQTGSYVSGWISYDDNRPFIEIPIQK